MTEFLFVCFYMKTFIIRNLFFNFAALHLLRLHIENAPIGANNLSSALK